jgi:hypothetical protein
MEAKPKKETGSETMFEHWMKASMDFWKNMVELQSTVWGPMSGLSKMAGSSTEQDQNMRQTGSPFFQFMQPFFSQPQAMSLFLTGPAMIPGFMATIAQQTWQNFVEMQKIFQVRSAEDDQRPKADKTESLNLNIFTTWKEIYEKEFQKFLNVPQLGLTRFYQERINRFFNETHLFLTVLAEFVHLFYIPLEKSLGVMQQKVEKLIEDGQMPNDYKELYLMWIKNLEGHYLTLLKSPEYTGVLNRTLHNLARYKNARNQLIYDLFDDLPIPTNREMDDLYEEIYHLKKKVRKLSTSIRKFDNVFTHSVLSAE